MEHNLDHTLVLLAHTPAALNVLLRELPEFWTGSNEGDETWTAREVVGHLVHCERVDFLARVKRILEFGDSKAFDPLDRFAHLKETSETPLPALLDEFARLRAANLDEVRSLKLGPEQLALRGLHPALGTVTLSQLVASWAAHDMTHLHQIARILAHQYRDAVGPWANYMGVMKCTAHSG
jgi:uncharacterized damage-inducible protein DinB